MPHVSENSMIAAVARTIDLQIASCERSMARRAQLFADRQWELLVDASRSEVEEFTELRRLNRLIDKLRRELK